MGCSASTRAEPELHVPLQPPDRSQQLLLATPLPPGAADLDSSFHMLRLRSLHDGAFKQDSARGGPPEEESPDTGAASEERRAREQDSAREAVAASTRTYGAANPHTLNSVLRLADVLATQGGAAQLAEAETLVRSVLTSASDASLEPTHAVVLNALQAKAALLAAQGRHEEALAPAREALAGLLRTRGEAHARTERARGALGAMLRAAGRDQEADELRRQAPKVVRDSTTIVGMDSKVLQELNAAVNAHVLHTATQQVYRG